MFKYTSIALMMGLMLLPTLSRTHPDEAERPEARQMISPIAALKNMQSIQAIATGKDGKMPLLSRC
jgi:hypothetical protein